MFYNKRWIADFILIMITFVWGTTFVLVQDAITTFPPFSFLAVRFGLAALLLFLIIRFFRNRTEKENPATDPRQNWIGGFVLGIFLFLGYAFQTFSLLYTTSGKSGFLTGVSVALVPVFTYFILGVRIKLSAATGVLLAIIGLYLLAFADFSDINRGDILAFLCAIFFALQIVYTGKFSARTSVFHLVAIQLATVALLSFFSAFTFESWQQILHPRIYEDPTVAWALMITSLFATAFAFIAQTHVQKFTTPTRVALIFTMEPVFAALADYWWQGVTLTGRSFIGAILILCGMILAEVPLAQLSVFKKRAKDKP
ncbi:DMT family transporter [Paenactinomyces guangxiensis]|uniref:DMT family transporter n=1 Tax=Paenactinomyces guangxiensis TaxID=1490290 RepID=A0A7W1WTH5_9BACL|nr:DMT family transporter [Paenactinomyces guangxiensis]MBA4495765.1 DMT family transporter [Paenactinomyces guangxiensis]MBH8592754.1 DMT family transporter [Paenactinomyces guangxiensis]